MSEFPNHNKRAASKIQEMEMISKVSKLLDLNSKKMVKEITKTLAIKKYFNKRVFIEPRAQFS